MSPHVEELIPPAQTESRPARAPISWPATWIVLLSLSAVVNTLLIIQHHGRQGFFTPLLAVAVCMLAALFDAWTKRIPNSLTYTAILLGIALNLIAALSTHLHLETVTRWLGAPGLTQMLVALGVCLFFGLLALLANVGGGDVKLLVALGALLGIAEIGSVLIVALTVALLYGLINLALFGRLNTFARILSLRLLELLYSRRIGNLFTDTSTDTPATVPMAVPLAIGLILSQYLNLQASLSALGGPT